MSTQLRTVKDFIRYAITEFNQHELFYGHGTENAIDEAFALVLGALKLPHDINPQLLDGRLTEKECASILKLIELRVTKRIPVAYLIHEAWFCGLPFYVNEHVLIPRSPVAELITKNFQPWIDPQNVHNILDLCTGSGCIAIACATYFPDAQVDASDIDEKALVVAEKNVTKLGVKSQVNLFQSDLFNQLPSKTYDIIISNPPYVSAAEMQELPEEYRHEPTLALAAGNLGLDLVDRILKEAPKHLSKEGILIVEVGNSEYALAEKYPHLPFTWLSFDHGGGGVFLLTAEQLEV